MSGTAHADDAVLFEVEDGVARVTLNNPGMRNALTQDVSLGLIDAMDRVEDSDARCVVVEGAGEAFCAGGDVNMMMQGLAGELSTAEKVEVIEQVTARSVARLATCPLPTVARIDGPAYGAGANVAIACDVQLASTDAKLSFSFRRVGLAVDSGTSYLLPRIVGSNLAKELVFTGRSLSAEEAADVGLVNHVYPADAFDEEAEAFVREVAEGPTVALRTSKRLLDRAFETSLSDAMASEAAAQGAVLETADHREGAESFMAGRDPEFEGR